MSLDNSTDEVPIGSPLQMFHFLIPVFDHGIWRLHSAGLICKQKIGSKERK